MKKNLLKKIAIPVKIMLPSIVTIFTLLILPKTNFAQTPFLGTAANFIAFSTDGAVTNTGSSQFTGNIGTNNGPITGFGNVNGVLHNSDGAAAQCAADLLIMYNQLNIATPTFFPSNLLGNGDTLVAGVYKIFSTSTLNATLYLDGKGNPNAVFIFQIQGAFSINAAAKIKLLNGTQACNVFWKVEGVVDMATATYMRGTIVANNAAINMTTNDTLEGRVLSTTGAITFNGVTTAIPTGCGATILTGPASPVLGSAACYAIFSGNGSVTNSGATYVLGDVGTNVGLTSGFDSTKVNGTIHKNPDVSTATCAADLQNIYNYLNIVTPDIELLYPAQFGNNLVLTPHTYLLNSATVLTNIVYLNAQDNTNAVFVIKVNGAFSTSTFSKVILLNGAQAKNVFWKVEGAVNINNNSIFSGTLVCNNAAVSLIAVDSINGRIFTTSGAISSSATIATMPAGSGCAILPISWIYFRGRTMQQNILLEWATANEINNSYFTVEKSSDGNNFKTLATVNPSSQVGSATNKYSIIDEQPNSLNFYRISQTDKYGKKNYFSSIQINMNKEMSVKVKNIVSYEFINIQIADAKPGNASIQLYDMNGAKLFSQKILLAKETSNYKINKPAHTGIYLICIESNGQRLYTEKVMVL